MERLADKKLFTLNQSSLKNFGTTLHTVNELKSFTLVELLIVIGILAILTGAVVVTLNPAEMLKKGRDGKRMEDIASLDKTINLLLTQNTDLSLGTAQKVYVSIPDSSATCANLGLPSLPSGYTYGCATQANLYKTDSTGWIPINFQSGTVSSLPTLPIDPTNTTSSGLYYRYIPGGSYHLEALLESNKYISAAQGDGGSSPAAIEKGSNLTLMPPIFPTGYVKVPGNSTFGTSDFYVMQYEAKYDDNADRIGDDAGSDVPPTGCRVSASYDTLDYANVSSPCPSSWSGTKLISSAYGSPIAGISHTQAVTACTEHGAHLLTNDEYMTIARNAEQQPQNWTSGTVGTGYLFNGNSGDATRGYDGADPEKGIGRNARAKYILSNGSEIYDIPGNVYEHVQRSTNNQGDNTSQITTPTCSSGTSWCDYGTTYATHITAYNDASFSASTIGPSDSSWDSTKGMGRVYPASGALSGYVFLRGGHWGNGSSAGAFMVTLYYGTGDTYHDVGFRCAR